MIAGRPVRAMTCAIVKVLPEPVTPSSTWSRSPPQPFAQLVDRLRLVPRRAEFGMKPVRFADIAFRALGDEQRQHALKIRRCGAMRQRRGRSPRPPRRAECEGQMRGFL